MRRLRIWIVRTLFGDLIGCAPHRMEVVAVQNQTVPAGLGTATLDETIVLVRCETCRTANSYRIAGKWSIEQIKGLPSARSVVDGLLGPDPNVTAPPFVRVE